MIDPKLRKHYESLIRDAVDDAIQAREESHKAWGLAWIWFCVAMVEWAFLFPIAYNTFMELFK